MVPIAEEPAFCTISGAVLAQFLKPISPCEPPASVRRTAGARSLHTVHCTRSLPIAHCCAPLHSFTSSLLHFPSTAHCSLSTDN